MNQRAWKKFFLDTDYVHRSGTPEELQAAEYLKARCEELGVPARLESFPVPMAEMEEAHVYADGKDIPCRGFFCCGSGEEEGELYYMPGLDPVSVAGAKDKIVLMDSQGIGFFPYQDLMKAGAKAILFQYGNLHYPNRDIDERDLRAHVVGDATKLLCAMLHCESAVALVKKDGAQRVPFGETHRTRFLKLDSLKKCDCPSPFPALRQLEAYGRDCE